MTKMKPCNYCRISLLLYFFFALSISGNSQTWLEKKLRSGEDNLRRAKVVVEQGRQFSESVFSFVKEVERTTASFNTTVNVVRGDSRNSLPKRTRSARIINGEIPGLQWNPVIFTEDQLFPSAIISLASYQGNLTPELEAVSRPVGLRILSEKANIAVHWEIESVNKEFFDKVSGVFFYEKPNQEVYIMPDIPWNYSSLSKQISDIPMQIIYRIFDDKGNKIEETRSVRMRSINDCVWRFRDTKMYYLFSAYIQEGHPEIDNILREALNTDFIDAIIGYQGGEDMVLLQVAAIWQSLHERNFKYSSITTTSALDNELVTSQSVRSFDSAHNAIQANCVDGTVVFASVLRKIGLDVEMVFVPGHCFLAFYNDNQRSKKYYLETTLLSNSALIDQAQTANERQQAFLDQFILALQKGQEAFNEHKDSPYFSAINIEEARKVVNAIPF